MVTPTHCLHLRAVAVRTETAGVGPAPSPGRLYGPACTCTYPRRHNTPNIYKGVAKRPNAPKEAVKGPHGRPG
jgi:hypothetical protein